MSESVDCNIVEKSVDLKPVLSAGNGCVDINQEMFCVGSSVVAL